MQENVRKHVKKAEEKRKIRRRTKILLGICCVLVAVGVVWGLILPGLAATGNKETEQTSAGGTISERINLSVSQKSPDDGKMDRFCMQPLVQPTQIRQIQSWYRFVSGLVIYRKELH